MNIIKAGTFLIVGLAGSLLITVNSAVAWPTRDHFDDMYDQCVIREGGYLTNGIISICTNEVIKDVLDRLEVRVEDMSQPKEFDQSNERLYAFDFEQRTTFLNGIEKYKESTVQVCDYMGYHVGGPANPLCVMDMLVNLLTILERYD